MAPKLKALIELFPNIPEEFLESLYSLALGDPCATNQFYQEIEVPEDMGDTDPGWYKTLITLNCLYLGGDLEKFQQESEPGVPAKWTEEPNYTTITIKTDYGC